MQQAKFAIGQVIKHRLFGYRGVIFDVDPRFSGSDEWYQKVARTRPPKEQPWYHVLVDGSLQETYVAERNLDADVSREPVEHPMLGLFFDRFEDGVYSRKHNMN